MGFPFSQNGWSRNGATTMMPRRARRVERLVPIGVRTEALRTRCRSSGWAARRLAHSRAQPILCQWHILRIPAMRARWCRLLLAASLGLFAATGAIAQCPAVVPAQGGALPAPLPLFPADNWWNADISARRSTPTPRASSRSSTTAARAGCIPTSAARRRRAASHIYGMPYAVVDGDAAEAGGDLRLLGRERRRQHVDGQGVPFYPIPAQAITQSALGRGRRARQRRPAQPERPPPADRRPHATGISTSSTTSTTTPRRRRGRPAPARSST